MPIESEEVRDSIEACQDCTTATNDCVSEHLGEPEMARAHRLCLDCADLCTACIPMMARGSDYSTRVCGILADLCEACAEECEKFDSEACRACAEACRRCAERCRAMAA